MVAGRRAGGLPALIASPGGSFTGTLVWEGAAAAAAAAASGKWRKTLPKASIFTIEI